MTSVADIARQIDDLNILERLQAYREARQTPPTHPLSERSPENRGKIPLAQRNALERPPGPERT